MPIPTPHRNEKHRKTESKSEFVSRCMGDKNMQEYEQPKRAAICYRQWGEKLSRAEMIVRAAGDEYISGPNIDLTDDEVAKIKAEYYHPFNKDNSPSIYGPEGPKTELSK